MNIYRILIFTLIILVVFAEINEAGVLKKIGRKLKRIFRRHRHRKHHQNKKAERSASPLSMETTPNPLTVTGLPEKLKGTTAALKNLQQNFPHHYKQTQSAANKTNTALKK